MKVRRSAQFPVVLTLIFMLFLSSSFLLSQYDLTGNITGNIYAKDGTTPLQGAVVRAKNMSTGESYESSPSDIYGNYQIENIEGGIYLFGVETPEGVFNAYGLVGLKIQEKDTAKMSFALRAYEQQMAAAIQEVYQEQQDRGEALVGRVLGFDARTGLAEISVLKGVLRMDDRIHTRGRFSDFYQDLSLLRIEGKAGDFVLSDQRAVIGLMHKAAPDDEIYVAQTSRTLPFFLSPIGVATVIAGDSSIVQDVATVEDEPKAASPFKIKGRF